MSRRSFIFCDICNPMAIRDVEMRRTAQRDPRAGRRVSDGRMWFDGDDAEAIRQGWVPTDDGQHICPSCLERMKAMRPVLEEQLFVPHAVAETLRDEKD